MRMSRRRDALHSRFVSFPSRIFLVGSAEVGDGERGHRNNYEEQWRGPNHNLSERERSLESRTRTDHVPPRDNACVDVRARPVRACVGDRHLSNYAILGI